ncbi:LOW QUALITY PROTEIN: Tetratricopeptide-like helical domain containing protein [Trema orientale]|uniref:Tetratricopeptide-like helical domain containing protein n=1 Tax=Trema orientale TaxID=63057 RepID=A0A2P5CGC9_TREOI|nr:LOW QUALITY PROTEIN: Tetratricopeptide-like helical domain containing protein [Trema orientale]
MSSRQKKAKEKTDLEEAFESAKTPEEMLRAFKNIESAYNETELGLASLKLGLKLDREGEDPEMALSFAERALNALDKDVLHAVQLAMANVKIAMGRREEALANLMNCLKIKEMTLGEDSLELGKANRDLAEAYVFVLNFKEGLPICRKALDIHKKELRQNSAEVAQDKRLLGDVVQHTDKESETRAMVFISMGKAHCRQEKFIDLKRCLEIARGILDKKERRTLALLEKLSQEHVEGSVSAILGWLLLLTGKVQQAIPYLESAAERLKESFGSKHFGIGYIFNNLGAAYLELDRPQSAAQMFAVAEDIMDVSLGPHHADLIEACQNLAKAYDAMGRYE